VDHGAGRGFCAPEALGGGAAGEGGYVPSVHSSLAISVCRGGIIRASLVFYGHWLGVLCGAVCIDLCGGREVGPDLGESKSFVLGGWTGEVVRIAGRHYSVRWWEGGGGGIVKNVMLDGCAIVENVGDPVEGFFVMCLDFPCIAEG
jgi:hypothetical protein